MAIHDVVLPTLIGEGTTGGPGFRTAVRKVDSGFETRFTNWDDRASRISYDVQPTMMKPAEMALLLNFVRGMRGPAHAFRMLDPADWSTHPAHNQTPNLVDPTHRQPVEGASGQKYFQLVKDYTDAAGVTYRRKITRPINVTHDVQKALLVLFVNGVAFYTSFLGAAYQTTAPALSAGVRVAVEYSTGRVYMSPAQTFGTFTWCGTFHTPAILHPDCDSGIDLVWEEREQWRARHLRVSGLPVDMGEGPEQFLHGGSGWVLAGAGGSIASLDRYQGSFQKVTSSGSGTFFVALPDFSISTGATPYGIDVSGGPWFQLWCVAGASSPITFVDHRGGIVGTVAAGTTRSLHLAWVGGDNGPGLTTTWYLS